MKHQPFFLLLAAAVFATAFQSKAQDRSPEIKLNTRISFVNTDDFNGFKGERLFVSVNGNINDNFSYSVLHNFNRNIPANDLFNATDWAFLRYTTDDKRFQFTGGKIVMDYGSIEYDAPPIDVFIESESWDNCKPFRFGVGAGWFADMQNLLRFQIVSSPFANALNPSLYAYSLAWYGKVGVWKSIWSYNVMEYASGRYSDHIALGNHFYFGRLQYILDFSSRADFPSFDHLEDITLATEISYHCFDNFRVFSKFTYDLNKTHSFSDGFSEQSWVYNGTEFAKLGAGFEYYANKNVRFHAFYCHKEGELCGAKYYLNEFSAGLSWFLRFKC